jgi:3-methyladenine DNA glycosylase AlkD
MYLNADLIVNEVLESLSDLGSPERRERTLTYISTIQRVAGVSNPELRALMKGIRANYGPASPGDWIRLCKALVGTSVFECQVLSYELIGKDRRLLDALVYEDLASLGQNLDNWASVDHYSVGIFGVLWRKGVVRDAHIEALLDSDNFWERRIAVVSTVALNLRSRGGLGDTARTLWVCEQVAEDRSEMIRKALSWALRELSKHDRAAVIGFMEQYRDRLAGRVIREVNHKLDFGTKT